LVAVFKFIFCVIYLVTELRQMTGVHVFVCYFVCHLGEREYISVLCGTF